METTTVAQDIDALFAQQADSADRISNYQDALALWHEIHDYPDADALARLATLIGLTLHRLLPLLLKHQHECGLVHATESHRRMSRFAPDSDQLFTLLAKYGYVPDSGAEDVGALDQMIRELILIDGHKLATHSPELCAYVERSRHARELWQRSPSQAQEQFRQEKSLWLDLQEQLGDQLLFLEARRLAQEAVHQRWLALFGEAYLVLQEQEARVEACRCRVEWKLAHPEITREALEQLVRDAESARKTKLRTLRSRLAIASLGITQHAAGVMSPEALSDYRRQCKNLLRQIWLLLHPDRLAHDAGYGRLTERQKATLEELWHRAMTVKESELGIEPGCVGADHRSLVVLHDILATVNGILAESGIETDIHLIITGETIEDQLAWVHRSIQRLEDELDAIHAELLTILNEPEIQQRTMDLDRTPSEQDARTQEMLAQARAHRDQAEQLEAQLKQLFSDEDNQT